MRGLTVQLDPKLGKALSKCYELGYSARSRIYLQVLTQHCGCIERLRISRVRLHTGGCASWRPQTAGTLLPSPGTFPSSAYRGRSVFWGDIRTNVLFPQALSISLVERRGNDPTRNCAGSAGPAKALLAWLMCGCLLLASSRLGLRAQDSSVYQPEF